MDETCKYEKCQHPVEEPVNVHKKYCIFHSGRPDWEKGYKPNTKEIKVLKDNITNKKTVFDQNFQNLLIDYVKNKSPLDCSGFVFPEVKIANKHFQNNVEFEESIFTDDVTFHDFSTIGFISFRNCFFLNNTQFNYVEIKGETDFFKSLFINPVNFSKCQFESYADFYGCEFNEAKFNDCRIKQGSFDDASFESLSLQGLITEGNLNFNIRGVEGFFDLQPASLGRSIEILNCKIGILKYKAHTGEKIKFNQTNLGFAVFKNTDCSKLSFLNMSLQKALFWGADLQGTRFEACEWEKAQPRKYSEQPPRLIRILIWFIRLIFLYLWTFKSDEISKVKGHDGIFEKINQFIKLPKQTIGDEQNKDPETKLKLLLSLYRQLKKNYEENHDFRQAGDSHYREMETRLLRMKYLKVLKKNQSKTEDKTKIEKVGFGEFHLFRFYGFISDFGENFPKLFEVLIRSVVYIGLLVAFIESGWVKKGVFYVNCWIKSKIPILASILEGIGWIINGIGRVVTAVASPLVKSGVLEGLNVFSKLLIGLETLFVFGVATLLVMAVRRRFRR